jgi:hypothetical protein
MKKRLIALLAALLLTAAVLPAGAGALTINDSVTTKVTAKCEIPDVAIDVTVPSTTTAYLNPSKASVSFSGTLAGDKEVEDQIITTLSYVTNNSEVPISVSAIITGSVGKRSTLDLREEAIPQGETEKAAFVYFQMVAVSDPKTVSWPNGYDPDKDIPVVKGQTEKENFVTIGSATQQNHFGAFRLTGECVADPEDDPWTSRDTFTAKIVFTFKALPYED